MWFHPIYNWIRGPTVVENLLQEAEAKIQWPEREGREAQVVTVSIDVFPKSNRFWMNLEYVGCISAQLIVISESKTNHKAVFVKISDSCWFLCRYFLEAIVQGVREADGDSVA